MIILIIIGLIILIGSITLICWLNYSYRDLWRCEDTTFQTPEWNEYDTIEYNEPLER